jgi:hypothetical protein
VAGEDVVQTLLLQNVDRDLEALQEVGGGRVGEEALSFAASISSQSQKERGILAVLAVASAFGETALKERPGGQHQPFLRPADGDVDAPLVVPVVHGGEGRDGVDEEEGRMPGPVDGAPHGRDAGGDARRGLVVDDADRLDGVAPVLG